MIHAEDVLTDVNNQTPCSIAITQAGTMQGVAFYCLYKTKHAMIKQLVTAPAGTV